MSLAPPNRTNRPKEELDMKKILIVAALALTLAPSTARADWLFTPYAGGVFGGLASGNASFGASLGWMGDGVFGFEADLGFNLSNNLFNTEDSELLGVDKDFLEARVTTFMGNAVLGYPIGGTDGNFSPYIVGGIGWFRTNVRPDESLFEEIESTTNQFGSNLGGGVIGYVNDSWGLRGDVRWFYSFDRPELDFDLLDVGVVNRVDVPTVDLIDIDMDRHFWRATGGVTFRW
jgi:opacity protein-like surface antigen